MIRGARGTTAGAGQVAGSCQSRGQRHGARGPPRSGAGAGCLTRLLGTTSSMRTVTDRQPGGRRTPERALRRLWHEEPSSRARVLVAGAVGAGAAVAAGLLASWMAAPLAGWDAAAVTWVAWTWLSVWHLDAEATARRAGREDPGRAGADALLLTASVTSLAAVALVVARAGNSAGLAKALEVGLGVVSIVCSWTVIHTVFTLRYARLYYAGSDGGVDFKQPGPPCLSDFAYMAFCVGMTFQVSDTDLKDPAFRRAVLRHALLSYLFGAVIIATTINLVAGLTK